MAKVDRRGFLRVTGAGAAAVALIPGRVAATVQNEIFRHGVASGDPLPDGVVIWTRVTPAADAVPGSGAGPRVEVAWQVARDDGFSEVVASGSIATGPGRDHTVKVDVRGLRPGTRYFYRFRLDDVASPTGRTRTAPGPSAAVAGLRLGVVSCSNWEAGYFSAYRHLADRGDLFGVIHLGDYLYEYETGGFGDVVRRHEPTHEILTLSDYRIRHGLHKTDPDLRRLHAQVPWMIVWDDHEVANDMWKGGAENHQPGTEGPWDRRLAAARRAYFEWMPIRAGAGGRVHRRLRFGRLADLTMLDLRSFRSEQVTGPDVDDPDRTMTGGPQMEWLKDGLSANEATWKLIGNSVMISPLALGALPAHLLGAMRELLGIPEGGFPVNTDQWDGYTADRKEIVNHLMDGRIRNAVFLTGDIHTSWANEVPVRAATYPLSPTAATELVVPSVTSDNIDDFLNVPPRTLSLTAESVIRTINRHVRQVELDSHGFGVLDVRPERVQMDYYHLADRTRRESGVRRWASFATKEGSQRLHRVRQPVR